jgi:hypothetical protein
VIHPSKSRTFREVTALSFVIPTGAQRSGGICSPCGVTAPDPSIQIANVPRSNGPILCHLDRSAAQWRDLRLPIPKPSLRVMTTLPLYTRPGECWRGPAVPPQHSYTKLVSTKPEYIFRLLVKFLDRLTPLRGVGNSGYSITDQLADERRWQWFVEGQMKTALGAAIRLQFFAEAVKKRPAEWHNA